MSKLAAVIITKNEEKRIRSCLDSLSSFVDEIVIVDDLSTDNTVNICRTYQAKILTNSSGGNFDHQRNLGIEAANSEWVIQMDADEVVPQATAKKIKQTLVNPEDFAAFSLRRKNFFFGHPLETEVFFDKAMVKLLKKGTARYTGRSVHETLEIDGKIGKIEGEVFHYPYSSISEVLTKVNFYTEVIAKNFVEDSESISFKEVKYQLTFKSLKRFWKLYLRKRGYREGMYGFIWCILKVIIPQIKWLKIWEIAVKASKLKY